MSKEAKSPINVGNKVLVRTVTHYYTGEIVGFNDVELLLSDAAWVSSTGRFAEALKNGDLEEVEPYPDGVISVARGAVVDVCTWAHKLPREVK